MKKSVVNRGKKLPGRVDKDSLEKWSEDVGKASVKSNASLLVYLSLLIYFFVSIASTSDEDILRETAKAIPLLNIKMPLWWFLFMGPWAFFLIHANEMVQNYYLSSKIADSRVCKSIFDASPSLFKNSSDITSCLISKIAFERQVPLFFRVVVNICIFLFYFACPIFLLVIFQVYSLPYHSVPLVWSQRVAVVLDLFLLISVLDKFYPLNGLFHSSYRSFYLFFVCAFVAVVVALVVFVFTIPDEWSDVWKFTSRKPAFQVLNLSGRVLNKNMAFPELIAKYSEGVSDFEKIETLLIGLNKAGLDLRNRDFRYADFEHSSLDFADFSHADLRGANFAGADLPYAKFTGANLQGTLFAFAHIDFCFFGNAHLEGAYFSDVMAVGPSFINAHIGGVKLYSAVFDFSDFSYADIKGATFVNCKFNFAQFVRSEFFASKITGTTFNGSLFDAATVVNCDFFGSKFFNYDENKFQSLFKNVLKDALPGSLSHLAGRFKLVNNGLFRPQNISAVNRVSWGMPVGGLEGNEFYDFIWARGETLFRLMRINKDISLEIAHGFGFFATSDNYDQKIIEWLIDTGSHEGFVDDEGIEYLKNLRNDNFPKVKMMPFYEKYR